MKAIWLVLTFLPLWAADPVTLARFSFLAGAWEGEMQGMAIEEHWMMPQADLMLGMYRISGGGKTRMTELCAIEAREAGPVLLLRHFSPGLVAREEKDAPVTLPLVESDGDQATFGDANTRLTYRRVDEKTLVVILEKPAAAKPSKQEFRYTRKK